MQTLSLVVLVPGMGDDVQAFKAGIMEIGDIFVLNKADHPHVDRAEKELQAALSLAARSDGWSPLISSNRGNSGRRDSEPHRPHRNV